MEETIESEVGLSLSHRAAKTEYSVKLFTALEPAHAVHAIADCRRKLIAEIETANAETLPALTSALMRVLEVGGRFYGLPTAPKGKPTSPGDNAKPVLALD